MTTRVFTLWAIAAALSAAACTVDQATPPSLTGPSDYARSVTVTATPDVINLGQGVGSLGDPSEILVRLFDESGNPPPPVDVRLDILVGSTPQDCGQLTPRIVRTANDGTAKATYTAPGNPPPFPQCSPFTGNGTTTVTIRATPVGTNFQAAVFRSVSIQLVPLGVILPPPGTPTPTFNYGPTPVTLNLPITFDASASLPGINAQISSYSWNFGDGSTGSDVRATHAFTTTGTFTVTLTVTNDRGIPASTSQSVSVGTSAAPTGAWVFSPASPVVGTVIQFNAQGVQAAPGRTIDSYNWDFGDGVTATGVTTTHPYLLAGSYTVVLTATDNLGIRATFPRTLTVGSGNPVPLITFSPAAPSAAAPPVFFDSVGSTTFGGATISTYAWTFPGGAPALSASPTQSVVFPAGTYIVRLTITDSLGRVGTTTVTVTVAP